MEAGPGSWPWIHPIIIDVSTLDPFIYNERGKDVMGRLRQFVNMSWKEKWSLAEASFFLGAARLMIKTLSFQRVRRLTGKPEQPEARDKTPANPEKLRDLGKTLEMASRNLPWECKCLVQAIAGKYMLSLRGIASTIYIGVAMDDDKGLASHAWLKSGAHFVTGEKGRENFTVITDLTEIPSGIS